MTTGHSAQTLLQLINAYRVSQAIHVVATLRIPAHLRDGPLTCDELAHLTNSHAVTLYRLLRALAAVGIFHESGDRRFALSPLGEGLRMDVPGSRGAWAQFVARPPLWQAWGHLLQSVRSGSNAFRQVHGMDVWAYRATMQRKARSSIWQCEKARSVSLMLRWRPTTSDSSNASSISVAAMAHSLRICLLAIPVSLGPFSTSRM
jgi:hypothetical protein